MNVNVTCSECSKRLDELEEESFDSCVTDPPYHFDGGFMDKEWDRSGISFDPEFWKKVKRVLKPGAHLAAFGGSETYHRIAVAIEDAGFELRESVDWIYAGGFAKSHDVSKAIDKHLGKKDDRKRVGLKEKASRKDGSMIQRNTYENQWVDNPSGWQERGRNPYKTAPASDEAEKWDGWDTQLKPAKEPIIIARKPLEGTVAENVLKHSTGALNVDGCRIEADDPPENVTTGEGFSKGKFMGNQGRGEGTIQGEDWEMPNGGRWPANVIFDRPMAERLNEQSGDLSSTRIGNPNDPKRGGDSDPVWGMSDGEKTHDFRDEGGAARYFKTIRYHPEDNVGFFYCPKAKSKEKNWGTENGNGHVTVKPIELMSYLVRLLTPKGGRTIDPFAGSGTTGMSAVLESVDAEIIEKNENYCETARQRVRYAETNYQSLREDIYGDPSNNLTKEETEVNDHNFW
jgi:site-specific DNA-methyltransferase (adenine-specific)